MPPELPGGHSERVDVLQAYARERLGMEIQAISHLGRPRGPHGAPEVWHVMTEAGTFWLVERAGVAELFAATVGGYWRRDPMRCPSALHAARRFLELHP